MSSRKLKLKLERSKIIEVLEKLGIENVDLEVDVQESKELYKTLSTDPGILDWEFIDSGITPKIKEEPEPEKPDSFDTLACHLEAAWKLSRKSPEIKYGSKLWKGEMESIYVGICSSPTTIEHLSLKTLLEIYYQGNLSQAIENVEEKIKTGWSYFSSHPSIMSLANFLFRSKP